MGRRSARIAGTIVAAASPSCLGMVVEEWQLLLPPGGEHEFSVRNAEMDILWWILIAIVWIAIAFWPARVAGRKGHSFFGYFIFSLFFFPAALIVAYAVHDGGYLSARAAAGG